MEIIISKETNASSSKRSADPSRKRTSGTKRPASAQRSASAARSASGQRPAGAQRSAQSASAKKRRKKRRRTNPLLVTLIIALVLVIGVFAAMGAYVMRYKDYNKILPNVYVAGIDVGGMSLKAGVVDESGKILHKGSCPTGVERGPRPVVLDMAHLAVRVAEESGIGMANIEVMFGAIPRHNLADLIYHGKNIREIITMGPMDIGFISGVSVSEGISCCFSSSFFTVTMHSNLQV